MALIRKIWVAGVVALLALGATGCGKGSSDADSGKGGEATAAATGSAQAPGAREMYDPVRAKEICDMYGAGMLSEKDYADIIRMVGVAFDAWQNGCEDLLDVERDSAGFSDACTDLNGHWRESYPYADGLFTIMMEADSVHIGAGNLAARDRLASQIRERETALKDKVRSRYGQRE